MADASDLIARIRAADLGPEERRDLLELRRRSTGRRGELQGQAVDGILALDRQMGRPLQASLLIEVALATDEDRAATLRAALFGEPGGYLSPAVARQRLEAFWATWDSLGVLTDLERTALERGLREIQRERARRGGRPSEQAEHAKWIAEAERIAHTEVNRHPSLPFPRTIDIARSVCRELGLAQKAKSVAEVIRGRMATLRDAESDQSPG